MPVAQSCRFSLIMKILLALLILFVATVAGIAAAVLGSQWVIEKQASLVFDDTEAIPHKRVGLVLGCSPMVAGKRPNLYFRYRIAAAVELFKADKVDYLLVSGDNHAVHYDEPTAMRDALIAGGLPEERIVLDYAGFSTLDSIVRAKKVFGQSELSIISQHDHAMRALYFAKHNDIDAVGFAARDVTGRHSTRTNIRESFARVRALLDVHLLVRKPRFLGEMIAIGE